MGIASGLFLVGLVGIVAIVVLSAWIGGRWRRAKTAARRVENYALFIEEREGFPFVQLKLQTADGFSTFELEPPYAHVLSDELITTSARAMALRIKETPHGTH